MQIINNLGPRKTLLTCRSRLLPEGATGICVEWPHPDLFLCIYEHMHVNII